MIRLLSVLHENSPLISPSQSLSRWNNKILLIDGVDGAEVDEVEVVGN